jgi:hypothetical protein
MKPVPDFAPIEGHIRKARLEHSAALGDAMGSVIAAFWHALKQTGAGVSADVSQRTSALKPVPVVSQRTVSLH